MQVDAYHANLWPMTLEQLGERFLRLADRKPAPNKGDAVLEVRRLGAHAARLWCGTRLSPTPWELYRWEEERTQRIEGICENLNELLTDEEREDIELACKNHLVFSDGQSDSSATIIPDRGYDLDHIWWHMWRILSSFVAVNFPNTVPSGYEYINIRNSNAGLLASWYKPLDSNWQSAAEDFAAVCLQLHQLSVDETIADSPEACLATWTIGKLVELLQIDSSTLGRYAKATGLPTAGRGKKNFFYTHDQAIRLVRHAAQKAGSKAIREQAELFLEDHETGE